MKSEPAFNEKWLQQKIADDPSVLGLGDLDVKDLERRQPRAGRLDILLTDPESLTRYEVEIQLGATDESHIIRTIEYWDIERSRYPQYDHVAVIVAEDITSRFLNVISLLNRSVPLIAIQMRALEVDGKVTLSATTVLDIFTLGTDDEDSPGAQTDRGYWVSRGSSKSLEAADAILELINSTTPGLTLKYNRHYIGLARDGIADNFIIMKPRKEHLICEVRIPRNDVTTSALERSGLDLMEYKQKWGRYRFRITTAEVISQRDLLLDLIKSSAAVAESEE